MCRFLVSIFLDIFAFFECVEQLQRAGGVSLPEGAASPECGRDKKKNKGGKK